MTATALELRDVTVRFGGLTALDSVSLVVPSGARVGIIGPNGAGKTTLFDVIGGLRTPEAGDVLLNGASLAGRSVYQRARFGVTRTFQNLGLFESLSVLDNVRTGIDWRRERGGSGTGRQAQRRRAEDAVWQALEDLELVSYAARPAATLSLGWRKRVEIARALVSRPRILLLDEPTAALFPEAVAEIGELIRGITVRHGITLLLIEHNVPFVSSVSDRLVVLASGRIIADGPGDEVRRNESVVRAYLGGRA